MKTHKDIEKAPSGRVPLAIDTMTAEEIISENNRRNRALQVPYDPVSGVGCSAPRVEWEWHDAAGNALLLHIPASMALELKDNPPPAAEEWETLRLRHDFEYWCATCATILDKISGRLSPLILNAPQRRVLQVLENQRLAQRPMRLIMLKARQWGGSTLVQTYMAWIQLTVKENWNSLIVGHLHQTSAVIKGMYSRLLRNYPTWASRDGERPEFKVFEGSRNVFRLSCGNSLVITGTAQNEDAVRGYDVKMAHLTEVAFWPSGARHDPQDVVRATAGSVPLEPMTLLVLESTANGVGDFFHDEWLRAKRGNSDKAAVFVPWYEIEIYSLAVDDVPALLNAMDDYEKMLWERGCTLEKINWYHHKRREYQQQWLMAAEFPTTDVEAFNSTSRNVFATHQVERLRPGCDVPCRLGEMVGTGRHGMERITFVENGERNMKVWALPQESRLRNRYVTVVDVGGTNSRSDWSVIAVFDRHNENPELQPEVVAQWRGHIDKDLLAWKAAQVARYYHNSLLVFESNSLENREVAEVSIRAVMREYGNVYVRGSALPGFHTNFKTKREAIANLIACVRDMDYVERDDEALNEMENYEISADGKRYEARRNTHDDILMTRAIGLLIIKNLELQGVSRLCDASDFVGDRIAAVTPR